MFVSQKANELLVSDSMDGLERDKNLKLLGLKALNLPFDGNKEHIDSKRLLPRTKLTT